MPKYGGVHYPNDKKGKTNGFLVENSHGEKGGFKGNFYMLK